MSFLLNPDYFQSDFMDPMYSLHNPVTVPVPKPVSVSVGTQTDACVPLQLGTVILRRCLSRDVVLKFLAQELELSEEFVMAS
jgi:hypothetical protein